MKNGPVTVTSGTGPKGMKHMAPSTDGDDDKVVAFSPSTELTSEQRAARRLKVEVEQVSDEERARRLRVEVERLAGLPVSEWMFWLDSVAKERGIEPAKLKQMIEAQVRENEKKKREAKAEEQRREQQIEKQKNSAQREEERKRRQQDREQERADKEAAKKEKEKQKGFEKLMKLPKAARENKLVELAKQLDEDLELLKDDFWAFVGTEEESYAGDIEPWPDPVDTNALLTELTVQLRRYILVRDDDILAIALWVMFAWVHEAIAVYSPILLFTSPDGDCGKTTACGVVKFLTPRGHSTAELTGPSLFRFVDHVKPTLIIDDADNLLKDKPDLEHIINVSWTRDTKIPRQDHGVTRWFDPFCPKLVSGVNVALKKATMTRTIKIKFKPKLPEEKTDDFNHVDDDSFVALRRKAMRWTTDNAEALKGARPILPPGFANRLKMNWILQLAIADLAGGDWPKSARRAAIILARERREPSVGVRALETFRLLFATQGPELTSTDAQRLFAADPDGEWAEFNGPGRPITKRQIALLLDPYDIHPDVIHPKGRKSERGYKAEWFADAFARYLRSVGSNRTTVRNSRKKPQK
jgi:putative DNA primase/helicase